MTLRRILELNTADLNLQDCELAGGLTRAGLVGFANIYGYLYPKPEMIPELQGLTDGSLGGWDAWILILAAKRGRAVLRARFGPGEVVPLGLVPRRAFGKMGMPVAPTVLAARFAAYHREAPEKLYHEHVASVTIPRGRSAEETVVWPLHLCRDASGYFYRAAQKDFPTLPEPTGPERWETFGEAWGSMDDAVQSFGPMMLETLGPETMG